MAIEVAKGFIVGAAAVIGFTTPPIADGCNTLEGEAPCNKLSGRGGCMTQAVGNFADANPGDVDFYTLDFTSQMSPGDSIASASWFCNAVTNVADDPDPSARILGDAVLNGPTVTTTKAGNWPFAGVQYALGANVVTQLGLKKTLWAFLDVVPVGC